MPKRTLKMLEVEQGKPLDEIIPPLASKHGVVGAAKLIRFSPSTVSDWLKFNNFKPRTTWERVGEVKR